MCDDVNVPEGVPSSKLAPPAGLFRGVESNGSGEGRFWETERERDDRTSSVDDGEREVGRDGVTNGLDLEGV